MTITMDLAPDVEKLVKARAKAKGIPLEDYLPSLVAEAVQQAEWQEDIPGGSLGRLTMLAAEPVLTRIWDTPEEDAAWKYLEDEENGSV